MSEAERLARNEIARKYRAENLEKLRAQARERYRMRHVRKKRPKKIEVVNGKKECTSCGLVLALNEFTYNGRFNYYNRKCKSCVRESVLNKSGEKRCARCSELKPYSEYRRTGQGHDTHCRECRRIVLRERYNSDNEYAQRRNENNKRSNRKHRARCREALKKWKAKNPERVLQQRLNYLPRHRIASKKHFEKHKDKILKRGREYGKKLRGAVDERYIKYYLRRETGIKEIPTSLIKIKRLQILAKRIIKTKITNHESHRTTRPNVESAI